MKRTSIPNAAGILLMSLSLIFITSCSKDDDNTPKDPTDAVTLNMQNEQNGKTLLGNSDVYINKSNNFYTSRCLISDAGNASGVGANIPFKLGNLVREAAVVPGHLYHIFDKQTMRDFPSGNRAVQVGTGFYQVYTVSSITADNGSSSGAVIKYVLAYPDRKGLPELDHDLGRFINAGETIEMTLPKGAECVFEEHYGSGESDAFEISVANGILAITLKKSADSNIGPYGTYRTYIRVGNAFSTVIVNVL